MPLLIKYQQSVAGALATTVILQEHRQIIEIDTNVSLSQIAILAIAALAPPPVEEPALAYKL